MGQIIFVEHDGTEHYVDIEVGKSLMQMAMDNLVPGIDADCGGECACGTCHVIVAANWKSELGVAGDDERQMLSMTPEKTDGSRLACQITVTDELDGLKLSLPEFQM